MLQLRKLLANRAGVAATEFALVAPLILTIFLGTMEITRYLQVAQKVEKTAYTVSDLVAQADSATTAELDQLVLAAEQIMQPFGMDARGVVIITSIEKVGTNPPVVRWRYTGGGDLEEASQLGDVGSNAVLPEGFTLSDKENIIIAEVYYNYETLLGEAVLGEGTTLYRKAIFKPRLGSLATLG
jgi:Flp pilus assembly pilin Flp